MAGDIDVKLSGPLFDGRARRIMTDLEQDMQTAVAQDAISTVHQLLDRSIRNPTPYYETQIVMQRFIDRTEVHDRGIVYGPWLEGTSSRNWTTRFKGYASFRRAAQQVDERVPRTVASALRRAIGRLN